MATARKITAGHYALGQWTISRLEGEDRDSFYRWLAESPEAEHRFRTKAEAIAFVQNTAKGA